MKAPAVYRSGVIAGFGIGVSSTSAAYQWINGSPRWAITLAALAVIGLAAMVHMLRLLRQDEDRL